MFNTIVDNYIDLDLLINSLDVWNNNIFKQLNKNHVGLCDKKTPTIHTTKINKFIVRFKKSIIYMTETHYCNAIINGRNILFKLCSHEHKHIFFIVIKMQYHYFSMVGIIDNDIDMFLFVGVENSHPFYINENISYGNSDGSTSNIKIDHETECYELFDTMSKHFNDFANDKWH